MDSGGQVEGFSSGSKKTKQRSERKERLISILKRIKGLEMDNGHETTVAKSKKGIRRRLEILSEMSGKERVKLVRGQVVLGGQFCQNYNRPPFELNIILKKFLLRK